MREDEGEKSDDLTYRLIVEAVPLYILDSPYVAYFIRKMKSPNALNRVLKRLLVMKPEKKVSRDILQALANNENCPQDSLQVIEESL